VACARGDGNAVTDLDDPVDAGDAGAGTARDGSATPPPPGTPPPPATGTHVVINEVQTGSSSNASDEFVELANPTSSSVSLSGWTLVYSSAGGSTPTTLYTFKSGDSIAAGGRVFVASTNIAGRLGALTPGMSGTAGQVGLLDDAGKTVDGVGYGTVTKSTFVESKAAPSPPSSGSIARTPDGTDTDDNSADFKAATSATPGDPN
jgi:predicted extracellular nuclease